MKKTYILFEAHSEYNSSLVDCLDLLLWSKKHSIDIGIAIVKRTENVDDLKHVHNNIDILDMLYHTRYCGYLSEQFSNKMFEDDIIVIDKAMIPAYIKNAVIFDYITFLSCKDHLKNTKVFFVSNMLETDVEEDFTIPDNVICAGTHLYDFIINKTYRQKYMLNALKQCYHQEKNRKTLVICPGYSIEDIQNGFKSNIWGSARYDFNSFDYVLRNISSVISGIYNGIKEVIYFQSPVEYDRNPRTILEAKFLGIPVEYHFIRDTNIRVKNDGSAIRALNIHYELEDREYSFDDDLIKWIIANE